MTPGDQRLAAALQAEHAAIYGYGVAGAKLDPSGMNLARNSEAVHRARRDDLVVRLTSKGTTPPAAAAAYALPFPVNDRSSALKLLLAIEERTAALWRAALPDTAGDERKLVLDALTDCANRAVTYRRLSGVSPLSVAFPGVSRT